MKPVDLVRKLRREAAFEPATLGPVMTKTRSGLQVEEPNQLAPLALREAADGLRLADPALVEQLGRLDPPELRDRHEDVAHLRGLDVGRRSAQDLLDLDAAVLEVFLQLSAAHADVVGSLEGLHPLVERPLGSLGLGLGRNHECGSLTPLTASSI